MCEAGFLGQRFGTEVWDRGLGQRFGTEVWWIEIDPLVTMGQTGCGVEYGTGCREAPKKPGDCS